MATHHASEEQLRLVGNIPMRIEAEWDALASQLAGFPLNLLYSGTRPVDAEGGGQRMVAACYWFDPGTYREDDQIREMQYFPREESPYSVRVTLRKDTGVWETFKYRAEALVCTASSPNFETAMLHTTLTGLEPDEPESDLSRAV